MLFTMIALHLSVIIIIIIICMIQFRYTNMHSLAPALRKILIRVLHEDFKPLRRPVFLRHRRFMPIIWIHVYPTQPTQTEYDQKSKPDDISLLSYNYNNLTRKHHIKYKLINILLVLWSGVTIPAAMH
jgi:hypothetical protein